MKETLLLQGIIFLLRREDVVGGNLIRWTISVDDRELKLNQISKNKSYYSIKWMGIWIGFSSDWHVIGMSE